ncbi:MULTISPECIES: hypothetical protein [unclassified Sphingomonas]|jgi:hypothetical protein|uniref:hypothetical protein n=1 Tax=unclassified Sphingomonas TaxID=196159 RepID=UPI00285C7029|nr:hypothetical protein [Sphingomonas sp. BE123]MDR6851743.1 hypothetical protein [Sphingomonas sp. BE123]
MINYARFAPAGHSFPSIGIAGREQAILDQVLHQPTRLRSGATYAWSVEIQPFPEDMMVLLMVPVISHCQFA